MCDSFIQIDVVIPTQTKYLDLIGNIGERIAKKLDAYSGDKEELAYQINLVITEATVNAIKHSQHDDPRNTVRITIHLNRNELNIKVYDHGQGFDLAAVPMPDLEHPKESGLGIYLMRSLMDSVTYTRQSDCNILELVKHIK